MSACGYCLAATTDWIGGAYYADCRGCQVRMIASSPRHIREAEYRLCKSVAEREQLQQRVKAEHSRIQALRREKEDR